MRLTTHQILTLINALASLDGYDRVISEGENKERVVRDFHKIGGATRMTIAKNVARLREIADAHQKTRDQVIREISGGKETVAQDQMVEFNKQHAELLAAEHLVQIDTIKEEQLKLDSNPIPIAVLIAIQPILEGGVVSFGPAPMTNGRADARATAKPPGVAS